MKFTLEINCDNAAFDGDNLYPELARIVSGAGRALDVGSTALLLYDINGNKVGVFRLEDDSD